MAVLDSSQRRNLRRSTVWKANHLEGAFATFCVLRTDLSDNRHAVAVKCWDLLVVSVFCSEILTLDVCYEPVPCVKAPVLLQCTLSDALRVAATFVLHVADHYRPLQ